MDREQRESTEVCARCGTLVAIDLERGFSFGVGNVLCWSCAIERGGRYDEERDEWTVSPDVADLPDEAYGSTPREV